ncbi:hypothetical protein EG329_006884 [Mollisiaceae sp. DMI_Dod_QoI]|nr:hypothetical protein EG329_006884 [Helotiales sp. DMI_Dod_QoI]
MAGLDKGCQWRLPAGGGNLLRGGTRGILPNFLGTVSLGILVLTCEVANSANEVHAYGNIPQGEARNFDASLYLPSSSRLARSQNLFPTKD